MSLNKIEFHLNRIPYFGNSESQIYSSFRPPKVPKVEVVSEEDDEEETAVMDAKLILRDIDMSGI